MMMPILKPLLLHMRELGYDIFAPGYGFSTPTQENILMNGFDNHKCNERVNDVCRVMVTDGICNAWLDSLPPDQPATFDALKTWRSDAESSTDDHFRNHLYMALNLLPVYTLYIKGQRSNDFAAYN
jgi:hypothetical protein